MTAPLMDRRLTDRYESFEEWHWWFRGRQRILEAVLHREVGWPDSLSVVSLGCGPAQGIEWLARVAGPGGRVVGLDGDTQLTPTGPLASTFVIGSAEQVPLADASFDLVLLLDVLEHLDDDVGALREASRILRPGGTLLITVPAWPFLWGQQDEVSHHRRRYTRETLRAAFEGAQLPLPRLAYFNALFFPPIALVRVLRRRFGFPRETRSDFEDSEPGPLNEVLARLFGAERHFVGRLPIPFGVSLLAVLKAADEPGRL